METTWTKEIEDTIEKNQADIVKFDFSEDGRKYNRITGLTLWRKLNADELPRGFAGLY